MKKKKILIIIGVIILIIVLSVSSFLIVKNLKKQKEPVDLIETKDGELVLWGDRKETPIIPETDMNNTIVSQKENYNLEGIGIANIRAELIDGVYGCMVLADVVNNTAQDLVDYKMIFTLYDDKNNELVSFTKKINLKVGETDSINEVYLDEDHSNLLDFTQYKVTH